MKKNFKNLIPYITFSVYGILFFMPTATAQTWQASTKKLPVVVENTACNSATDTLGIKSDRSAILTCQSGTWRSL